MSLTKQEKDFFNNVKHDILKLIIKVEQLEQQIAILNNKQKRQKEYK